MESNNLSIYDEDYLKSKIYIIRGVQVMLDADLAEIYGYTTKRFNEQVKNNIERFDEDFRLIDGLRIANQQFSATQEHYLTLYVFNEELQKYVYNNIPKAGSRAKNWQRLLLWANKLRHPRCAYFR